jgi:hypothetical protein
MAGVHPAGRKVVSPGRTDPEQITLFINAGTQGLQFAAVAVASVSSPVPGTRPAGPEANRLEDHQPSLPDARDTVALSASRRKRAAGSPQTGSTACTPVTRSLW